MEIKKKNTIFFSFTVEVMYQKGVGTLPLITLKLKVETFKKKF